MRICIFGGTFDPIHIGHLILAEHVREELSLDRIIFVPCNIPPHKHPAKITEPSLRLKMVELAIRENPYFKVSSVEIDRGGVSYTVETMEYMRNHFRSDKENTFLLIGGDSILDIPNWYHPERIFELCTVAVVHRPGYDKKKINPRFAENIVEVETPLLEISSTEIRRRAHAKRSIKYLVPQKVAEFIKEHRLYI